MAYTHDIHIRTRVHTRAPSYSLLLHTRWAPHSHVLVKHAESLRAAAQLLPHACLPGRAAHSLQQHGTFASHAALATAFAATSSATM